MDRQGVHGLKLFLSLAMPPPAKAATPRKIRQALGQLHLTPRKGLAQHFLVDGQVVQAILNAAQVSAGDCVVESGPGLGILTQQLATRVRPAQEPENAAERAGQVIAVEIDPELSESLAAHMGPSVRVVTADARKVDIPQLVEGCSGYKVVGNLPYYAANPMVRRFLESPCKPSVMVVMVQREVAHQMAAAPGKMSLLSVGVQVYGRPTIVRTVPPKVFYPRPKVTSAIVRIDVYPQPVLPVDEVDAFFRVVRAGFSAPRKQLRNSLAHGLKIPESQAGTLLQAGDIDPRRRAQTVSLEEWERLYRAVASSDEPD